MRGLTTLSLAVLSVLSAAALRGQDSVETRNKIWTAEWITAPGASARDGAVLHFRKTIQLARTPQHFVIHVSADNQFALYVNGQRAGNGPARGDLAHWRYETYDIAPLLHSGANLVAATVWNFGTSSAIAQMSERIGVLVHGDNEVERVLDTNSSWEVEEDKGITPIRPQVHGYYAAEPGERLDGTKFDWSWCSDSVERQESWAKAVSLRHAALRGARDAPNNWQLVPDALPPVEMTLMSAGALVRTTGVAPTSFPKSPFIVPAHTKATMLLDNSRLTTAYPHLSVSEGQGSIIRLTYAEALVDDHGQKGNRNQIDGKHMEGIFDEFLPSGASSCEFMPLNWRTWRYLQLDIETKDQPLQLRALDTWFSAYPFIEKAHFQADDPSLAAIWEIGWRTARLDAHDTYMDTPYWERLQYIGDTRIQSLISYVMSGDDRLARQAIEAFNASRIPDGLTQSRYPSSLVQMIPPFSLLWVGMVHDFWLYRGDPDFVRAQLPGTRAVLDWFLRHQRSDGLLGNLPWWLFVDWGKDFADGVPPQDQDGGSAILTLQMVEALRYGAEFEERVGDPRIAETYRKAADRAAQAVWKLCWNHQYGLLADTPARQHYTQHANILGVWLDVIPPAQQKTVLEKILSASDSGFSPSGLVPAMTVATYYFRFYLARALDHAGMADAYLRLLGPWREMLSLGLTTWAESPEPTRSDSHAWSAHPNYDLLTIVAGIRPKTPGFEKVTIAPHLGTLRHVHAALPVVQGLVQVEYTRVAKGIEAQINLPAGLSGELIWQGREFSLAPGPQTLNLP